MPLNLLLILVIGGIASITLLLHFSGKSARKVIGAEDARAAWHRHFPDDLIHDIHLAKDGFAALVITNQGPGLLWSFGADTTARHLRDYDFVEGVGFQDVLFRDYTAPKVRLHLNPAEVKLWQNLMMTT